MFRRAKFTLAIIFASRLDELLDTRKTVQNEIFAMSPFFVDVQQVSFERGRLVGYA
jgi:hypothetical protein